MTLIAKLRRLLKGHLLLIFIFFSATGFHLPPKLAETLNKIPWVGEHVKIPQPPEKERQEAQKTLEEARLAGAPDYAPTLWTKAQKLFNQGEKFFREGKYSWAKTRFEESQRVAEEALQKARGKRHALKKAAFEKYNQLLQQIPAEERNNLTLKIRLRYLKGLIEQEDFSTFEEELKRLRQEIPKLKRGPKPPSLNKRD